MLWLGHLLGAVSGCDLGVFLLYIKPPSINGACLESLLTSLFVLGGGVVSSFFSLNMPQ